MVWPKVDKRRLSDLAEIWFTKYGCSLVRGKYNAQKFRLMIEAMGNPLATSFNSKMYADFRSQRMSGQIVFVNEDRWKRGKANTATINYELSCFKGLFNKLKELGEWSKANPLEELKLFKLSQSEMAFLSSEQIEQLLCDVVRHKKKDMLLVVKLCLATGARWNEAAQLKGSQLTKYKVTFTNTKTGKNRSVPISEELYHEIYKPTSGQLFDECYMAFRHILKNKITPPLPSGQASHVLRHTFASHFMMNGGNILVLRDILGHADISMTMRYAHFAPDHLSEAVTHNPLNQLRSQ